LPIESIFKAPDIRQQTLQQAENFIAAKRTKRMIVVHTYKEKVLTKAVKIEEAELIKFEKRKALLDKALEGIETAILKAEKYLANLNDTHTTVSNVQGVIKDAL
jgi:hypothetical protein